jgi:hypothetical protein
MSIYTLYTSSAAYSKTFMKLTFLKLVLWYLIMKILINDEMLEKELFTSLFYLHRKMQVIGLPWDPDLGPPI